MGCGLFKRRCTVSPCLTMFSREQSPKQSLFSLFLVTILLVIQRSEYRHEDLFSPNITRVLFLLTRQTKGSKKMCLRMSLGVAENGGHEIS